MRFNIVNVIMVEYNKVITPSKKRGGGTQIASPIELDTLCVFTL